MTAVNKEHIVVNVPQCDARTLQQHAVVSGDLLGEVRQQRDVDVAQTSSLTKHHEITPVSLALTAGTVYYNSNALSLLDFQEAYIIISIHKPKPNCPGHLLVLGH